MSSLELIAIDVVLFLPLVALVLAAALSSPRKRAQPRRGLDRG